MDKLIGYSDLPVNDQIGLYIIIPKYVHGKRNHK